MALKTLHFVQGLSRTPLSFIPRYLTNIFFENVFKTNNLENRRSENLKNRSWKVKVSLFVSARTVGPKKNAKTADELKNRFFHKNLFFHYFKWNWGGLGVSRVTARTIRTHRHNFSRDLVLHGIRKSTFREYWNFNVLEMVFKTFHFVPGLSRTPLLFIPRYFTNIFYLEYF